MKKQSPEETQTFNDVTIPAFLDTAPMKDEHHIVVKPEKNPIDGQVHFVVRGRDINGALAKLYANQPVGALDLIRSLKTLRSAIFTLKGTRS